MQTKKQIQQLLDAAGVRPNKKFGQHFLIDLNLMRLLLDPADIKRNESVLEVGCGTDSLTSEVVGKAGFVIAVELDRILASLAQSSLANIDNIEIINDDILKNKHTICHEVVSSLESARKKCNGRILLVANLPYNVASPTIMNLVTGPVVADAMYITIQKEVADRMIALPDSGEYGILSILLNAVGQVRVIRVLKPSVFWPQPQVDSAMVEFVHNRQKLESIKNIELFIETVNLFMGHRRKTLKGCSRLATGKLAKIDNIKGISWPDIFIRCDIEPTKRPEQLSSEQYVTIANICFSAFEKA